MRLKVRRERYVLPLILILMLTGGPTFAQAGDSTRQTARHALYGGLGFGSDMTYSGYSLSGAQPYYSADLLYSYNRSWTAAFMAYHLADTRPTVAFYDFHQIDLKVESAVGEGSRFIFALPAL